MLFNSIHFLIFFLIVLLVYWRLPLKGQNYWLLAASFFFYGYWDWRFLSLLIFTATLDFWLSQWIFKARQNDKSRSAKFLLGLSLLANVGLLISFKAFGLFDAILREHDSANRYGSVDYVIPIGISFYTFQALSYVIDVYKGQLQPAKNLREFWLFISFFPQLIAGPIEKGAHLLPQITSSRSVTFDTFTRALSIFVWGLFLKTVIADNLLPFTVGYFESPAKAYTLDILLASYMTAFQVYSDFGGYAYMAIGLGGMLGFRLSENFHFPYFSKGPQEFWSRWHITLVNWFRSYVFMPLTRLISGSFSKNHSAALALIVTMLVFALWHAFSLTFLIWGFLQALIFLLYHRLNTLASKRKLPRLPTWLQILIWFHLLILTSIIYRSRSLEDLPLHFANLFRGFRPVRPELWITAVTFIVPLLLIEAWHLKRKQKLFFANETWALRFVAAIIIYGLIITCGAPASWSFIYFHF